MGLGGTSAVAGPLPYDFSWSTVAGSSGYTLSGSGSISIVSKTDTLLDLLIKLTNTTTTTDGDGKDARLTAFGFGISPDATGFSFVDAADDGMVAASLGNDVPSLTGIEVCAFGGNNCQGGSNGGIYGDGKSSDPGFDEFHVKLTGDWAAFSQEKIVIEPAGFKYQTNKGSYEFYASATSTPDNPTPAPATLALLGVALVGMGWVRRRN
jgi:hypothetical protein